jgi:hypothetical protein
MSGYLSPSVDATPNDAALAAIFQTLVAGLTGMPPTLIFPRWQPVPPTMPVPGTDWCAIGITSYHGYDYPFWTQDTVTYGTAHRYERVDVLATFYGPSSSYNAGVLRDALYLNWNARLLEFNTGIKLRSADEIVHLGEEVNAAMLQRSDLPLSFVRMVERSYAITAVGAVPVNFITDTGLTCTITASIL